MPSSPVFIVGSPRSGTSILTSGLLNSGYVGFYEGNFLSLIRTVERQVDRHFQVFYSSNPKVMTSRINQSLLKESLAKVFIQTVVDLHTENAWLDKTGGPEMIEAIPLLRATFLDSRIILAKRRAIENLVSRLIKFPQFDFAYHCNDWARTMKAWRSLKAISPGDDMIEIDQREISSKPDAVTERLGRFLQLSSAGKVSLLKQFVSNRPQATDAGSSSRVLSLDATGWSEDQIRIFHKLCDEEMDAEGYSTDETYWRAGVHSNGE